MESESLFLTGTYLERTKQALINTHHCTSIVKFSTIVRSAEQCYELSLREKLITILDDLMRTAYQIHVVFLKETRDDIGTKRERDTTVVFAPTRDVLVGIGPEEVAQKTAIGNLYQSADQALSLTEPGGSCSKLGTREMGYNVAGGKPPEGERLTSVGRITRRICSIEFRSGLRPPCMVKIFSSMMAAIGKQLKQSVNVFQSLMLYLRLHSS